MSTKPAGLGLAAGRPSNSNKEKAAAMKAVMDTEKKMVRINFEVDEETHAALKIHAVKTGRSVTQILRELVRGELSK